MVLRKRELLFVHIVVQPRSLLRTCGFGLSKTRQLSALCFETIGSIPYVNVCERVSPFMDFSFKRSILV
jgi:hypothetical protein